MGRANPGLVVIGAVALAAASCQTSPAPFGQVTALVTLVDAPPGPVPLLATATVAWRSPVAVEWVASISTAGTTSAEASRSGSAAANETVSIARHGWEVAEGGEILHVRVTTAAGDRAELEVPLARDPAVVGETVASGSCGDLSLAPDGRRAYAAAGAVVTVFDVDPASPTRGAPLASFAQPLTVAALAIAPGGERLWVSVAETGPSPPAFLAMDPLTGATTAIPLPVPGAVRGITPTADGRRLYASTFPLLRLDVDPLSGVTGAAVLGERGGGWLTLAASGRRLFAGDVVYDADPVSATYDQRVGVLSQNPYGAAAAGGDGPFCAVSCVLRWGGCGLYAFDPLTLGSLASRPLEWCWSWSLAASPDGGLLLVASDCSPVVTLVRATDLVELGSVPIPVGAGFHIGHLRVTADGAHAYALASGGAAGDACRLVRIPLQWPRRGRGGGLPAGAPGGRTRRRGARRVLDRGGGMA